MEQQQQQQPDEKQQREAMPPPEKARKLNNNSSSNGSPPGEPTPPAPTLTPVTPTGTPTGTAAGSPAEPPTPHTPPAQMQTPTPTSAAAVVASSSCSPKPSPTPNLIITNRACSLPTVKPSPLRVAGPRATARTPSLLLIPGGFTGASPVPTPSPIPGCQSPSVSMQQHLMNKEEREMSKLFSSHRYSYVDMPVELVIVRHGESEGNLAQDRAKAGDPTDFNKEAFSSKHTSKYRLTTKGRLQATLAGNWIKANFEPAGHFDFHFCSEYVRAMETAGCLNLPRAKWVTDFYIRERDGGVYGGQPRSAIDSNEVKRRERDLFYYCPPGGESIANGCLRVDLFLQKLASNCSGLRVIVVAHRTIMHCFRILLERTKQQDFLAVFRARSETMDNCHILHYSRRNPSTREVHSHLSWMRSVNPLRPMVNSEWLLINRPHFSNKAVMAVVNSVPQAVDNTPAELEEFKMLVERAERELEVQRQAEQDKNKADDS
eukprot:TRINITY_DN1433_c0_g1_i1.p1 TRINITY_DN1433_c0_g1~~TRINITY_DN1433_c0_g1_i1.p1  ORF type:complete len:489 (-),score=123.58 TRINITY_DN1433_c0_g1_i1:106-1572(-)